MKLIIAFYYICFWYVVICLTMIHHFFNKTNCHVYTCISHAISKFQIGALSCVLFCNNMNCILKNVKLIGVIIIIIILPFYKLVSRVNLIPWTYKKTNANVLSWGKKNKIAIEDSGKLLMSLCPASFPTWLQMGRQIVIQYVPGSSHRSCPWGWFSLNETEKSHHYVLVQKAIQV